MSRLALLALEGLSVSYGMVRALDNLDLEVDEGEVVCLLGANGAGKSTTLRAISGVVRPCGGTIVCGDRPLAGLRPEEIASLGIAHLPERRGIFSTLSVLENLEIGAYGAGISKKRTPERVERALSLFPQLKPRLSQRAGTLSGGEQQMLGLARALLTEPRLLLVDELSFGLAPALVKGLFAHVAQVARDGTGVLLVEQFVGDALAIASRAYVLEKGAVMFSGPSGKLKSEPGFVEQFYLGHQSAERPLGNDNGFARQEVRLQLPGRLWRDVGRAAVRAGKPESEYVAQALTTLLTASDAGRGECPSNGDEQERPAGGGKGGAERGGSRGTGVRSARTSQRTPRATGGGRKK
ncbi:MAG: ABC transporter ATP-binding protein [Actinomycetota bacterium]